MVGTRNATTIEDREAVKLATTEYANKLTEWNVTAKMEQWT